MFGGYVDIYRRKKYVVPPCVRLLCCLTSTPSPLDHVCTKKIAPEGFIPFGLRLIFLFFETLK